ncbi:MAG: pesticin C-terminus-like muramidase [Plesiomonas shigelloides]
MEHDKFMQYGRGLGLWQNPRESIEPDPIKHFRDDPVYLKPVSQGYWVDGEPTIDEMDPKWLKVPRGQLTFDVEGDDVDGSRWFSRVIHWPGGVSGVTIGRGYDLGQQSDPEADLTKAGIDEPLKKWLVGAKGKSGKAAKDYFNSAPSEIKSAKITRHQQFILFNTTYNRLESDVKRICSKATAIKMYHPNPYADPDVAWNNIPQKMKEVLVDLRYRGDYTTESRKAIQRAAYSGDDAGFMSALENETVWKNVPNDRFLRRQAYYAK